MDFIHNSPQFHALINAATEAKEAEKSPGLSGAAGPAKGGMSVLQLHSPTGLYSPDLGSKSFNGRRKQSSSANGEGNGNGAGSAPTSPVLSASGRPHKRVRTQFDDEEEKIPVERSKKTDKVTSGGSSCHQCKSRRNYSDLTYCTSALNKKNKQSAACRKKYCDHCLKKFYHETPIPNQSWKCPSCRHICCCAACRRRETRDRPERKASPRFSPKPAPRSASQSPRIAPLAMPSNSPSPFHSGSSRSPYTKAANPTNGNGNGNFYSLSTASASASASAFPSASAHYPSLGLGTPSVSVLAGLGSPSVMTLPPPPPKYRTGSTPSPKFSPPGMDILLHLAHSSPTMSPPSFSLSPYVTGGFASERKDSNGTRIFTPNGVRGRSAPISPHMKPLPASALGPPARASSASPDDDDDDYSEEEDSDEEDDDDDDDYNARSGSRTRSRSASQSRSMKGSNTIINAMTSINKSPLLAAARFLTTNPAPIVTPGHSPTLNGYNPAAVRRSPAVTPRMTPRLSPPPVPVYPSVLSLDSSASVSGANAGDSMAQFNSVLQRSTSMLSMSSTSSSGTGDQRLLLSQIAPSASSSSAPVLASVEGAQAFTTLYAVASLPQNKAAMEQIMSNAALSDSEKVSQVSALLSQSLSTLNPQPRRLSLSTSTSSENGFCLGASSPASIASSSSFNPSPSSSSGRPPLPSPPSSPSMSPIASPSLPASAREAVVPEVLLSLTRSPMVSSHPVSASPPSMSMGKSILTPNNVTNTMGTSLLSTVHSAAAAMLPMTMAVPANTVMHAHVTPTITVTPPTTNATATTTNATIASATQLA